MSHTPSSGKSIRAYLLSGGAWAFGGKLSTAFSALAVNALLARLLTLEAMGAYFLTFSLVSVAAVLAQLGLNQTVVRLVAESMGMHKPGRARAAVRAVFRYGAIGAFIVAGLLTLWAGQWLALQLFNSLLMESVIALSAVWLVVLTFQSLLAETFRGFHDIRLATIFGGLVTSLLSASLFALLWFMQGYSDLKQVIILAIAAGGTSTVIAGLRLQGKVRDIRDIGNNEQLAGKEILSIAWPLLITNLTLFALTQADLWILGAFRAQEEVAIYCAASRLAILVGMPLIVVNAVVPPLIAELYAQGRKEELERAMRATATLAGIPAFVALVGFILFGESILTLLYGSYYREGATVLALLSVGQLVNVWAGSCGLTLMMTGHQTTMMGITILCGIITIVGAICVVKDHGGTGVALLAGTTMTLQNILMLFFSRKKVGIWTHVRFGIPTIPQMDRR